MRKEIKRSEYAMYSVPEQLNDEWGWEIGRIMIRQTTDEYGNLVQWFSDGGRIILAPSGNPLPIEYWSDLDELLIEKGGKSANY